MARHGRGRRDGVRGAVALAGALGAVAVLGGAVAALGPVSVGQAEARGVAPAVRPVAVPAPFAAPTLDAALPACSAPAPISRGWLSAGGGDGPARSATRVARAAPTPPPAALDMEPEPRVAATFHRCLGARPPSPASRVLRT